MIVDSPCREIPPPYREIRKALRLAAYFTTALAILVAAAGLIVALAIAWPMLAVGFAVERGWRGAWVGALWFVTSGAVAAYYQMYWRAFMLTMDMFYDWAAGKDG